MTKKAQLLLVSVLLTKICIGQIFPGQKSIIQIAKNHFRSNPFDREFSQFLNHLMNDPTIGNKKILKRTDTSFFYFSGEYSDYNPLFL